MIQFFSVLCSLFLVLPLTACSSEAKQLSTNQTSNASIRTEYSTSSAAKDDASSNEADNDRQIQITTSSEKTADEGSTPEFYDVRSSAPPETSSGTISAPKQEPPTVQTPPPTQSVPTTQPPASNTPETPPKEDESVKNIRVTVGNEIFTATPAENAAAKSFVKLMKAAPVVISMSDYSGFEKVGFLGTDLPTSNSNTTTQSGDIVLYNGNQIVIFYGSNTWSYTRLGKIDDLSGWEEALGSGDITVTFSIE